MLNLALLPVHEEMPLDDRLTGLNVPSHFPVIVGDFKELDGFCGNIDTLKLDVDSTFQQIGLRKPALQHHRSAQVLTPSHDGSELVPTIIESNGQQRLVTAKGITMTRPVSGVMTDTKDRPFPFT